MDFTVLHKSRGRIRVHLRRRRMSLAEADQLEEALNALPGVRAAKVYDRTCDAVIQYEGRQQPIAEALLAFRFDREALALFVPENSARALGRVYQEALVSMTVSRLARKLFFPAALRTAATLLRSVRFIGRGLRCLLRGKLEAEVLDAVSIGVSMLRGDFETAGSVMFLLRLGGLLEE